MMSTPQRCVTELLADLHAGDETAEAELLGEVHDELRRLAQGQR